MSIYLQGLERAITLILSGDRELVEITFRSLYVSSTAVIIAGIIGIPIGTWLGTLRPTFWKNLFIRLIYVLMGLPPVLAGLILFLLLSRSGPIAKYVYLLYTPTAMILAQLMLSLPIVIGLVYVVAEEKAPVVIMTAKGLGANRFQTLTTLMKEIRFPAITALVSAFGRVIAEVGAVMLVGGDIAGKTRVLTTSIVIETRKGNFDLAIALGLVLLLVSFMVNSLLFSWQQGGKNR
ncbi:ABC transporter permease [Tepidibacillus fermentans]|uniref:Tungstate transport system permease protein n=1 Tax=Tepidibacillus fermentans TaxID=1281767 RepID=A0A4V6NZ12_9BACI|nr:ABC transporter permease [Tepidibacillus fermentans]TCS84529.1 tungstate transport system permease protein [Tepidibacillus fermentans]